MDGFNFLAVFLAALVPLAIGFVWYNPKLFGTAWMREAAVTEDMMKTGNMPMIFGVTFLVSFLLAFFTHFLVIHQFGAYGLVGGNATDPTFVALMEAHGNAFRTFKHGALHGIMAGILMVFPILAINALFERKSWKYILLNAGYWTVCLAIMGGIVCGM